jgi:mobilome CxxCx(11)CxxC protein
MLDAPILERIQSAKMNALCGKVLHSRELRCRRLVNSLIDYLGIVVPIVLLVLTLVVLRFHLPEGVFVTVADILTGLILLVAILKLSLGWQDEVEKRALLLSENIDLVREADSFLGRHNTASKEAAEMFLEKADSIEKEDIKIFGELSEPKRQDTYRLGLRQHGRDARCPCGASPWEFHPGHCQICGGTPGSVPPPVPPPPTTPPTSYPAN